MFKSIIFLGLFFVVVSGKVVVDIVDEGNKFNVLLINNGSTEMPIAGYRIIAEDTTWDSISSDLELSQFNYDSDYALQQMGIYSQSIHQINFKEPSQAVLASDDTISVTYFYSSLENLPEIFNEPYGMDIELSSVILRGYSDSNNTQLTPYNNSDIFPPLVQFDFPVHYNRNSTLYGSAYDSSGIRKLNSYDIENWIAKSLEWVYWTSDSEVEFGVSFDHDLSWDFPGWVVAYDSCGNGTVLEVRVDISAIETSSENHYRKPTFNGNSINLLNTKHKGDINVEMRDIKGRLVYSTKVGLKEKSVSIPLDSRCINAGIYFISLKSNYIKETIKVSINR